MDPRIKFYDDQGRELRQGIRRPNRAYATVEEQKEALKRAQVKSNNKKRDELRELRAMKQSIIAAIKTRIEN